MFIPNISVAMTSHRKLKRIHFGDYDGGAVMDRTLNQKAYNHVMHSPSGLRYTDGLSHACEHIDGTYRLGNPAYVAGTNSIRDVYGDLTSPIKHT